MKKCIQVSIQTRINHISIKISTQRLKSSITIILLRETHHVTHQHPVQRQSGIISLKLIRFKIFNHNNTHNLTDITQMSKWWMSSDTWEKMCEIWGNNGRKKELRDWFKRNWRKNLRAKPKGQEKHQTHTKDHQF